MNDLIQLDLNSIPTKIIYALEENNIYNVEVHGLFKDQNGRIIKAVINYKTKKLPAVDALNFELDPNEELWTLTLEN